MANPGFGPRDKRVAPVPFDVMPIRGSSNPWQTADRVFLGISGQDRLGRVPFYFAMGEKRLWRFIFQDITVAQVDEFQDRMNERECLYYTDTETAGFFYHVKFLEDRLEVQEGKNNILSVRLSFVELW